jgi:hypothetical protein
MGKSYRPRANWRITPFRHSRVRAMPTERGFSQVDQILGRKDPTPAVSEDGRTGFCFNGLRFVVDR